MEHKPFLFVVTILLSLFSVIVPVPFATAAEGGATLIAMAYEDQNADGAYGLTAAGVEPVLAGIMLELYIDNEPLRALGPEDKLLSSQPSNEDGYAVFHGLLPGFYLLNVHVPQGLIATNPTLQAVEVGGDAMGAVVEWLFGFTPRSNMPVRAYLPAMTCGPVR
jgi:hypothetical protein